jgi:hypothetical protein
MSVYAPIKRDDGWFKGADKVFRYQIVDSAGAAQDVTSWTFEWVLRRTPAGATAHISKTLGSGIALVGAAGLGVIDVTILDTDTDALTAAEDYFFTLWRTNDNAEVELAYGEAVLRQPAVRA